MRPLALLLLGLAAACTAPARVPLPPDHPANPTAPEGPPIVLSPTLARGASLGAPAVTPVPAPAPEAGAQTPGEEHHHHAH